MRKLITNNEVWQDLPTKNKDMKFRNQKKNNKKRHWGQAKIEENKNRNIKRRKAKTRKDKKEDKKMGNNRHQKVNHKEELEKEHDKRRRLRWEQIQKQLGNKLKMQNGANIERNRMRSPDKVESLSVVENTLRLEQRKRLPKIRNSYKIRQSVFEMDKKLSQDPGKLRFHLRQIFSNFLDREVIFMFNLCILL